MRAARLSYEDKEENGDRKDGRCTNNVQRTGFREPRSLPANVPDEPLLRCSFESAQGNFAP